MQLKSFDDITSNYQHIYLSPHFDDVVYSCGGTIGIQASSGQQPLVITVFAGVPSSELKASSFALKVHRIMGFGQDAEVVVATRRQEDGNALTYLHADYLWLDYFDAIYRGTPAYYTRNQLICGKVHPIDCWIEKRLAQDVVTLHERLPNITWYAPLGVGLHVDHQLVSAAVGHLIRRGANVKFYEDFPYARRTWKLRKRLRQLGVTLKPISIEISEMLHIRQKAAEIYTSQVKLNFGNKETMYKVMKDYTRSIHSGKVVHIERFWAACQ